jgi:HlyD family secretion protein
LKKLLVFLLAVVAVVIGWGVLRKNKPPEVPFARVQRQKLVSTLPTNGKVEPFEWQSVRAETPGLVSRVAVREGQTVASGAVLAEVSEPGLQADIQGAEARLAEARANLSALEAGGRPSELTEIENSVTRARVDVEQTQKEYDALRRLAEKQAATRAEVSVAQARMEAARLSILALEKRRASLVGKPEVAAAQARVQDAEAALALARARAGQGVLRAPIGGVVYELVARPGAYLNRGDPVANIGRTDRMRVRVYVDEPELGRLTEGDPVSITWDAAPGKQWQGSVERKPVSIQPLGSRQVGEVVCTVENPGRELAPGANVNAEIRTAVVENARVVPKETLRHDAAGDYVLILTGDRVERRPVKAGISSIAQVQIVQGLAEGDAVAMPSDVALKPGDRVTPATR